MQLHYSCTALHTGSLDSGHHNIAIATVKLSTTVIQEYNTKSQILFTGYLHFSK